MKPLPTDDLTDIVQRVHDWSRFRNARIFMTGGTGFFGTWMLSALLAADNQLGLNLKIAVLSRCPENFEQHHPHIACANNLQFVQGDITSFDFPAGSYDYIFHFAATSAEATFNGEDQLKKLEMLYFGTKRVLDFAVAASVKKILFTSSGVVYGQMDDELEGVGEGFRGSPDVSRPDAALGEGKRIAEYLFAYYHEKYKISYAIARCFSFIGPHLPLDIHYAAGNFVKNCLDGKDIIISGNGQPIRSYLYIGDATSWLIKILTATDQKSIYNVGSSRSITIEELAVVIKKILKTNNKIIINNKHKTLDNFSRNLYLPKLSLIKDKLSVIEWTSLEKSIEKMAKFYSKIN